MKLPTFQGSIYCHFESLITHSVKKIKKQESSKSLLGKTGGEHVVGSIQRGTHRKESRGEHLGMNTQGGEHLGMSTQGSTQGGACRDEGSRNKSESLTTLPRVALPCTVAVGS